MCRQEIEEILAEIFAKIYKEVNSNDSEFICKLLCLDPKILYFEFEKVNMFKLGQNYSKGIMEKDLNIFYINVTIRENSTITIYNTNKILENFYGKYKENFNNPDEITNDKFSIWFRKIRYLAENLELKDNQ